MCVHFDFRVFIFNASSFVIAFRSISSMPLLRSLLASPNSVVRILKFCRKAWGDGDGGKVGNPTDAAVRTKRAKGQFTGIDKVDDGMVSPTISLHETNDEQQITYRKLNSFRLLLWATHLYLKNNNIQFLISTFVKLIYTLYTGYIVLKYLSEFQSYLFAFCLIVNYEVWERQWFMYHLYRISNQHRDFHI